MKNTLLSSLILSFLLISCSPRQTIKRSTSSIDTGKYFEDVTDASGIADIASTTITTGDFDNDGLVDFIAKGTLYKNISKEQISFVDVTTSVGLGKLSGYPTFIDINNDGALDIITERGMLFIQKNKKFVDSTQEYQLDLPEKAMSLSFSDVNRDGFPDLLVGQSEIYENNIFSFLPGKFYINVGGKKFKDETHRFKLDKYPAYTRGTQWADFDNDGTNEVYFSNYRLRQNFLFKNQNGIFTEVAGKYKVQGEKDPNRFFDPHHKKNFGPQYGHTIGSSWADFNNDGFLDLWVANLVHKFVGMSKDKYDYRGYVCDDSKIYKNDGPPYYTFTDVRKSSGIPMMPIGDFTKYKGDELWSQITSADFDNDGLIDTYVAQVYNLKYAHSLLFKNQGNFKFSDVSATEPTRVLDSYGGAWADFNNDGKMDLIVSGREAVNAKPRLKVFQNIYHNPNNHFVKIRLIGKSSGRNPVGTQVRITHDKGITMRQYEGVSGTLGQQNDPTLHFGLGNVRSIKAVEVRWSSGKILNVTGVKLDKTYVVTEQN